MNKDEDNEEEEPCDNNNETILFIISFTWSFEKEVG
jgi:hypothetical protein